MVAFVCLSLFFRGSRRLLLLPLLKLPLTFPPSPKQTPPTNHGLHYSDAFHSRSKIGGLPALLIDRPIDRSTQRGPPPARSFASRRAYASVRRGQQPRGLHLGVAKCCQLSSGDISRFYPHLRSILIDSPGYTPRIDRHAGRRRSRGRLGACGESSHPRRASTPLVEGRVGA